MEWLVVSRTSCFDYMLKCWMSSVVHELLESSIELDQCRLVLCGPAKR